MWKVPSWSHGVDDHRSLNHGVRYLGADVRGLSGGPLMVRCSDKDMESLCLCFVVLGTLVAAPGLYPCSYS